MRPGTIIVNEDPALVCADFLRDYDVTYALIFEAIAGADAARISEARACYREAVATLAAALGSPDLTPTRTQGLRHPPAEIDRRWATASVWLIDPVIVATISGLNGGAIEVSLCRGKS